MERHLSKPVKFLIALCVFHIAVNVIWLLLNSAPIAWDQAGHTRLAVDYLRYFQGTYHRTDLHFLTISSYYPPLTHLVVAFFLFFTGPSVFGATFPISLYFASLLIGIFMLVKALTKDEWLALFTAVFFSFFPVVYESSRSFLLDIPLLTMLVFSWFFLYKTNYFEQGKYVFLFTLTAIGVILTKWIGVAFLGIPVMFAIWERTKRGWHYQHKAQVLVCGILALIIVLPWYAANMQRLIEIGRLASQGEVTDPQELLSAENLLFYLVHFLNFQVTLWPGLVTIATAFYFFFQRTAPYRLLLGSFLLSGYVLFTVISNKDIRYTLPLLVVLAFTNAFALTKWWKNKHWIGFSLVAASLIILILQFFVLSFHLLPTYQRAWNLGPLGWIDYINTGDIVVKHPQKDLTPNEEILQYLTLQHPNDGISIMVGVDQPHINPSTLDLYITLNNYRQISLEAPYNIERFENDQAMLTYLDRFTYILVPTGEVGPDAVRHKQALLQIQQHVLYDQTEKYQNMRSFPSSQGGTIILLRKL